ncbi:MAG TPA: NlpC/P60 family protein [Micromonosporaceae bacterium]|nr:NlpC/P60 family protein [Micromonosporaceae bacterium]
MSVEPGDHAEVRVAVATLWSDPTAPRPVDARALGVPSDVRGWVAGMSPEEQIHQGVLTQLLLGERVLVEQARDGWVRVVALEQPAARLDPRGYPGWLPTDQLARVSPADGQPYVVDATATALRDEPAGDPALTGVAVGTRLTVVGAASRGWLPVRVPGLDVPLWVLARDVVPAPAGAPEPAEVLEVARRLLDVGYVWGGLSAYGVDCSGLVHLAWRRFGVAVPRDADDQRVAAEPVPLGEERPGDLYFFARPGQPVHHVGYVAAPPEGDRREMVHACYTSRRVVAEPVAGERADTLVGAGRVRPAAAGG